MDPKGYDILKIETKINVLEKELSVLFQDFKKQQMGMNALSEKQQYNKI